MIKQPKFQLPTLFHAYRYAKGIYKFDNEWSQTQTLPFSLRDWRKSACILAREHYFETQKEYPIKNIYHLYRAIKAEQIALASTSRYVLWAITRFKLGDWQVTFWSVPQDVISELETSFRFIVPETLLLSFNVENEKISCFQENTGQVYAYRGEHGFVSAHKDTLVPSVERFSMLINRYELLDNIRHFSKSDTSEIMLDNFFSLPVYYLPGLFFTKKKQAKDISLSLREHRYPALLFIAITAAYGAGLSWYISDKLANQEELLKQRRGEMSVLVEEQRKLEDTENQLAAFYELEKNNPGLNRVLTELSVLTEEQFGFVLKNISIVNTQVIIRAEAVTATAILSKLSQLSGVENIEFVGSIAENKRSNLDSFSIRFNYAINDAGDHNE